MKNLIFEVKETSAEITNFENPRRRGTSRETLNESEKPLLFLMPLVEIAWAHGAVARAEKQIIFAAAREDRIDEKSALNETLDELLVYQPGKRFFENCLEMIKAELAALPVRERARKFALLISRCEHIAAAAGNSAMDVDRYVSAEERDVLHRLVAALDFRGAATAAA